jgi:CheY-like chemotaxis protein
VPNPTILIVEDDANDAFFLRRSIEKAHLSCEIRFVGDGDAAIAYLAGEGVYADRFAYPLPLLMTLDLKLPRLSGHEVLRWVRAQPGLRRLPVIILSSSVEPIDINQAHDDGANAYVVKPGGLNGMIELMSALGGFWITHHCPADISSEVIESR